MSDLKDKILSDYKEYVFQNYAPYPIVMDHGIGSKLYDTEGNSYLDFLGGIAVNSLGYKNPEISKAIAEQSEKLLTCSNYFINAPAADLAKRLVDGTGFKRAFLCNSGTEAMEAALKLVKKYSNDRKSGAYKFVSFINSFHGRSIGALSATGQDKYKAPFAPLPDWFSFVPFGDKDALKEALSDKTVAALIIECVQGESGVVIPSLEFMKEVSALVKKYGKLLIVDEVQTGIGRTGSFFAYTQFGLEPDILITAKGLAGGIPIGAVLAADALAETFGPGDHGTTFGGNALAAAVGLAVLKVIKNKAFLSEVADKGAYLKDKLNAVKIRYSEYIKDVRGLGLMVGMELFGSLTAKDFNKKFLDKGLILLAAGNNTLRFVPPLVVSKSEIDEAVGIIELVFKDLKGN